MKLPALLSAVGLSLYILAVFFLGRVYDTSFVIGEASILKETTYKCPLFGFYYPFTTMSRSKAELFVDLETLGAISESDYEVFDGIVGLYAWSDSGDVSGNSAQKALYRDLIQRSDKILQWAKEDPDSTRDFIVDILAEMDNASKDIFRNYRSYQAVLDTLDDRIARSGGDG